MNARLFRRLRKGLFSRYFASNQLGYFNVRNLSPTFTGTLPLKRHATKAFKERPRCQPIRDNTATWSTSNTIPIFVTRKRPKRSKYSAQLSTARATIFAFGIGAYSDAREISPVAILGCRNGRTTQARRCRTRPLIICWHGMLTAQLRRFGNSLFEHNSHVLIFELVK